MPVNVVSLVTAALERPAYPVNAFPNAMWVGFSYVAIAGKTAVA